MRRLGAAAVRGVWPDIFQWSAIENRMLDGKLKVVRMRCKV